VDQYIPRPAGRLLDNAAAALAYLASVGTTAGFSGPTHLVRKALAHLKEIEEATWKKDIWTIFAKYVCGALYTMLPHIFNTAEIGAKILEEVQISLRNRAVKTGRLPLWAAKTLDFEIMPAAEVRVNRFLAEAYLKQGRRNQVEKLLSRIIELTDPKDEHSRWARIMRIELKPSEKS
jgi:hypothetical protein